MGSRGIAGAGRPARPEHSCSFTNSLLTICPACLGFNWRERNTMTYPTFGRPSDQPNGQQNIPGPSPYGVNPGPSQPYAPSIPSGPQASQAPYGAPQQVKPASGKNSLIIGVVIGAVIGAILGAGGM